MEKSVNGGQKKMTQSQFILTCGKKFGKYFASKYLDDIFCNFEVIVLTNQLGNRL